MQMLKLNHTPEGKGIDSSPSRKEKNVLSMKYHKYQI